MAMPNIFYPVVTRKVRNKIKCNGYKNWDTWVCGAVMSTDYNTFNYVRGNKNYILTLPKEKKIKTLNAYSHGMLREVCSRNVNASELNKQILEL